MANQKVNVNLFFLTVLLFYIKKMLALQQKWIKPEERLLFLDLSQFIYLTTILTLYENPGL